MIYKIRNKKSGEFWKTPNGKEQWTRSRFAKSAWAEWMTDDHSNKTYFNDQDEYEIVEFVLIEKEKYNDMIKLYNDMEKE